MNIEGFAIAPDSTCVDGVKEAIWSDDGISAAGHEGHALYSGTFPCGLAVEAMSAAVRLGLKNSDDVGTKFDLQGVVKKGSTVVGSGTLPGVNGGSSGFNNASLPTIPMTGSTTVVSGDQLTFELSARISCSVAGHKSGTARLWYDDAAANSRLALTLGGTAKTFFLHTLAPQLSETIGAGPRQTADTLVTSSVDCATRPYTLIKAFTMTMA